MSHRPDSMSIAFWKWPRHIAPEDRVLFGTYVLYDLEIDIGETTDVAGENPEIVAQLVKLLDWAKEDIGDLGRRGSNARPLGEEPYLTPNELIPEESLNSISQ